MGYRRPRLYNKAKWNGWRSGWRRTREQASAYSPSLSAVAKRICAHHSLSFGNPFDNVFKILQARRLAFA